MSWLAGAAVALALVVVSGPRGRPVRRVAGVRDRPVQLGTNARLPAAGSEGPGARGVDRLRAPDPGIDRLGPTAAGARMTEWRPRRRWIGRVPGRERDGTAPDLALVVTDVAGRLRAGADPAAAWAAALGRPVEPVGPTVPDLSRSAGRRPHAVAVVAAGRLAADLGAPLAPLLDAVAEQLAAAAEAEGERRAALAGPRATARVLTWLPALGVLLGVAVGADPVAVLLDGSVGSAALAAGVVLVLVGRGWTARLARRAAAAGRAP